MKEVMERREITQMSSEPDSSSQNGAPSKTHPRRKIKFGPKSNLAKSPPQSASANRSSMTTARKKHLLHLQQMKQKHRQLSRSHSLPVVLDTPSSSSSSLSYIVDAGMGLIRGISRNLFNGFAGKKVSE